MPRPKRSKNIASARAPTRSNAPPNAPANAPANAPTNAATNILREAGEADELLNSLHDGSAESHASTAKIKSGKVLKSTKAVSSQTAQTRKNIPHNQDKAGKAYEMDQRKSIRKSGIMAAQTVSDESPRASSLSRTSSSRYIGRLHDAALKARNRLSQALSPKLNSPPRHNAPKGFQDTLVDGTASLFNDEIEATEIGPTKDVPPTPSMLSFANFRQRPRQPSILAMVQQSDLNANALDVHNNRDLEDSILAGLQRSPSNSDAGSHESPRSNSLLNSSNSRKRKAAMLDEVTHPSSEPWLDIADGLHEDLPNIAAVKDNLDGNREDVIDTYSDNPPNVERLTSPSIVATSPLSTPPSSHHQQTNVPSVLNKRTRKISNPKTAILKALLPRRLKTAQEVHRNTFDIYDSSELELHGTDGTGEEDDDMDELSRPMRKRINQAKPRITTTTKKGSSLTKSSSGTRGRHPLGKGAPKASDAVSKSQRPETGKRARTYGHQAVDEVENRTGGDDDESDIEVLSDGDNSIEVGRSAPTRAGRVSNELAIAKDKFKQVDGWEMEFESCDVGGDSSSPWR